MVQFLSEYGKMGVVLYSRTVLSKSVQYSFIFSARSSTRNPPFLILLLASFIEILQILAIVTHSLAELAVQGNMDSLYIWLLKFEVTTPCPHLGHSHP